MSLFKELLLFLCVAIYGVTVLFVRHCLRMECFCVFCSVNLVFVCHCLQIECFFVC